MSFIRLFCMLLLSLPLAKHAAAEAPHAGSPREVAINGVEFILIPEGWFWYTITTGDLGLQPADAPMFRNVRVWLDSYYLAKYEARARDFVRFMNSGPEPVGLMALQEQQIMRAAGDEPLPDPACTVGRDSAGIYSVIDRTRDLPATNMSWHLSDAFARWMGFRLPIEAEWEKAARGPAPERRLWPWGDAYPDDTYANFNGSTKCQPAPVTAYPKGRSPYGMYNMAGNVEEHVANWYSTVADAKLKDGAQNPAPGMAETPLGSYGPQKITKGGRWSMMAAGMLIAERSFDMEHSANNRSGVRFAIDASAVHMHLKQGTATIVSN